MALSVLKELLRIFLSGQALIHLKELLLRYSPKTSAAVTGKSRFRLEISATEWLQSRLRI